jgi:hypothetical protein
MTSLTWPEVLAFRLRRHRLAEPAARDGLPEVVGRVCGIHAQVMTSAEISVCLRVAGTIRGDVRSALWRERSLVKTYGVRGTVHLFPACELPLWTAAIGFAGPTVTPAKLRAMDVSAAGFGAMLDAIVEVLDGAQLTRAELTGEIARRVGRWAAAESFPAWGGRWPPAWLAIGAAGEAGLVCFGPNRGRYVTFVRADQWLGGRPAQAPPSPGEALAEVVRRYLGSYGPATHQEFAQWFRLRPAVAADVFRSLSDEIVQVHVEGRPAWILRRDADDVAGGRTAGVHLLPSFDCYLVGSYPRESVAPMGWAKARGLDRLPPGARTGREGLEGPLAVLLAGGAVAGLWQRRPGPGKVSRMVVEPFQPMTEEQDGQLAVRAARIAEILGTRLELSVGQTTIWCQRHDARDQPA